jgi:S-adenosylmethionine:tRNA ribosyltransferase-isomerase
MRVDQFDFTLPDDLIAQYPVEPRDASRLLVVRGEGLADRQVLDLPALLAPGDLLVFNDTRVIPARLYGRRGDVAVEFTLHKRLDGERWAAFARPAKRLAPGQTVRFAEDFSATVEEKRERGEIVLRFDRADGELFAAFGTHGSIPLPPYIRGGKAEAADADTYQTMFAAKEGAVAAPTAGLHFTPRLLEALAARGIETATLTLHVGAGTFMPVKTDDARDHVMLEEYGEITSMTAARINETRARGGRIVSVGTTSLRLLEGTAAADGTVRTFAGDVNLFIMPGYRFRCADLLVTNFHLPRSTLFMLVSAFSGLERMHAAYAHAVAARYRFYSYGDACLLHRVPSP